jgi:phage terminase large subunit-like protein
MCLFFPNGNKMFWKFFSPRTASNLRADRLTGYAQWVKDGYIVETDSTYISADEHVELIGKYLDYVDCVSIICRNEDMEVATKLSEKYGPVVQSTSVVATLMKRATQERLQNMVSTGQIVHGGNPMIAYQIGVTEIQMKDDTIRPHADHSRDNICGVFAGLLGIAGWMNAEPVYEPEIVSIDIDI